MTVSELINELIKIPNQNAEVYMLESDGKMTDIDVVNNVTYVTII